MHDTTWTKSHGSHISIYIGMVQPKGRILRPSHFQYKASLNSCPSRWHFLGTFQFLDQQVSLAAYKTRLYHLFRKGCTHTIPWATEMWTYESSTLFMTIFCPKTPCCHQNKRLVHFIYPIPSIYVIQQTCPTLHQKNGTYTVYKTSNQIQLDSTTRSLNIKDNSYKRS